MDQEEEKKQDEVQDQNKEQEEKHEANLIEVPQANLVEVDIDKLLFILLLFSFLNEDV